MIASIQGTIAANQDGYLVISVGGIGYKVFVPHAASSYRAGDEVHLHTHLVVREDALTLYGFKTQPERKLFETLLTLSGVGPRVALAILSTLSPTDLQEAVHAERADVLTHVPGIGKKTASKILFELKDKMDIGLEAAPAQMTYSDVNNDVIDSLIALGYSVVEAQTAVQSLPTDAPEDLEGRLRMALQYFA